MTTKIRAHVNFHEVDCYVEGPYFHVIKVKGAAVEDPSTSQWSLNCFEEVYAVTQSATCVTELKIHTRNYTAKKKLVFVQHTVRCNKLDDVSVIRDQVLLAAYPNGPRNLHVFINPVSGAGKAKKMWEEFAAPLLNLTIHNVHATITTHQGHAEEVCREMPLSEKDTLISVSGDGLLNEIINGVVSRPDFRPGMCTFGTIPGGSGNGLAKALGFMHPAEGAIAIAKGKIAMVDALKTLQSGTVRCGFLGIGYAITAEIDIDSESMRWMGNGRFTAYAVKKMLSWSLKGYDATLKFLPADNGSMKKETMSECTLRGAQDCPSCSAALSARGDGGTLPTASESDWVTVTGEFLFININNVPYISKDFKPTPYAHLADGTCDLVYVMRDQVSRPEMAKFLIQMELGSHVYSSKVHYVKCSKVILTPGKKNPTYVTIDGEVLKREELSVEVIHGALPFCVSNWDMESPIPKK